jgi:hypothetical protein
VDRSQQPTNGELLAQASAQAFLRQALARKEGHGAFLPTHKRPLSALIVILMPRIFRPSHRSIHMAVRDFGTAEGRKVVRQ